MKLNDKSLEMKFFKRSVMLRPNAGGVEAGEAYRAYLATIEHLLPSSAREFRAKARLHDSGVDKIEKTRGSLVLELDSFRVTFGDLSRFVAPAEELDEAVWLYSEVDTAPRGRFVLRVLMDEGELEVEAATVGLFDVEEKRWIVNPDEPDLEKPKKKRRRRKR